MYANGKERKIKRFGGMRMSYVIRNQRNVGTRLAAFSALLIAIIGFVSCGKEKSRTVVQKTFSSPDEAGTALLEAVKSNDQNALLVIFGPDAKGVVFSGDAIKDKDAFQYFVDAYNQMHRWREIKVGGEMLYMGADNYVFPVPLGKNPSGQWYFDTAAGKDEILARRIGKDELTAIAACAALAEAQQQYFSQAHDDGKAKQYAQKLVSDTDKQN